MLSKMLAGTMDAEVERVTAQAAGDAPRPRSDPPTACSTEPRPPRVTDRTAPPPRARRHLLVALRGS
jgi:hypothetical protein